MPNLQYLERPGLANILQGALDDFYFCDSHLRDHPTVRAAIYLRRKSCFECVAASGYRGTATLHNRVRLQWRFRKVWLGEGEWFIREKCEPAPFELVIPIVRQALLGILVVSSNSIFLSRQDLQALACLFAGLIAFVAQPAGSSPRANRELLEQYRRLINSSALFLWGRVSTLPTHPHWAITPAPDDILQWAYKVGLLVQQDRQVIHLVDATAHLIHYLRRTPELLHQLNPQQFERFVAERLDAAGYEVTLTGSTSSRDGGIDLIAVPRGSAIAPFLLAGQVKHHALGAKSGRDVVDRLLAWKNGPFAAALLVTNTSFTRDAIWAAAKDPTFLRLRDFSDLRRWIVDKFSEEQDWREIPRQIELAPGVHIDIPRLVSHDESVVHLQDVQAYTLELEPPRLG
jgi:hypothetical protein